jgi:hypothetical protein
MTATPAACRIATFALFVFPTLMCVSTPTINAFVGSAAALLS